MLRPWTDWSCTPLTHANRPFTAARNRPSACTRSLIARQNRTKFCEDTHTIAQTRSQCLQGRGVQRAESVIVVAGWGFPQALGSSQSRTDAAFIRSAWMACSVTEQCHCAADRRRWLFVSLQKASEYVKFWTLLISPNVSHVLPTDLGRCKTLTFWRIQGKKKVEVTNSPKHSDLRSYHSPCDWSCVTWITQLDISKKMFLPWSMFSSTHALHHTLACSFEIG